MKTLDEGDVRAMLRRRAEDVTPSPDAWERIQARIDTGGGRSRVARGARAVAIAAAAAAAASAVVAQALGPTPSTQVATPPGRTTERAAPVPDAPWVWPRADAQFPAVHDPIGIANAYIQDRTGVVPGDGSLSTTGARRGVVVYRAGPVMSEVTVVKAGTRWFVESARSDLVRVDALDYDGRTITGSAVVAADGALTLRYGGGDGDPVVEDPVGPVSSGEAIELRQAMPGEGWVSAGAVLQNADGTFAVTETWRPNPDASAVPDTHTDGSDGYTGVYPAFTGHELAGTADDVYRDPRSTAGAFLGDMLFPRGTSAVSFAVGEFRDADAVSGEVPFTLSDGARGIVVVRRTSAHAPVWYVVTAFTEPPLANDVRVEGGGVTVEPTPGATVTLAELQPLPGGDLVVAEPADHLLRFEDVTDGVAKLVGTDADGRTAFLVARVTSAG